MIEATHASRWYGQVIGLNDVSCQIGTGITALLGQNGAGKSTFIKLITGQLRPTTGEIRVWGDTPFANVEIFRKLGYCPETDNFYEDMTGRQFVSLMGRMSGIPASRVHGATQEVLNLVGMSERADSKIASYSKGMRQRIKIAQALIHDPELLVLDEPLSGLDPVGRRHISDLLKELATKNKIIIVSSHILYEVEALTQNILLLHRGRLLARGDVREIRSLIDRHPHQIRLKVDEARRLGPLLIQLPSVLSLEFNRNDPTELNLRTTQPDAFYSQFADIVLDHRIEIKDFYSPDNDLEAVFGYLVEK
ncbi:MAG TPA: ABC transporter ATP-binding protein [Fimbriimonadales bacterium]|nr:ABC transporter ATP-binding protein [Fimbriimonadales bacterium]